MRLGNGSALAIAGIMPSYFKNKATAWLSLLAMTLRQRTVLVADFEH